MGLQTKQEQIKRLKREIREEAQAKALLAGENIRVARKRKGITQEDLAELMGLTRVQVTNIETGRSQLTMPNLMILCDILESTPNALLGFNKSGESDE